MPRKITGQLCLSTQRRSIEGPERMYREGRRAKKLFQVLINAGAGEMDVKNTKRNENTARWLSRTCWRAIAGALSIWTLIPHLNNTIGKINKRAARGRSLTTAFAARKYKRIKIRGSLAAIDCCFDTLALWHFDGEHARVLLAVARICLTNGSRSFTKMKETNGVYKASVNKKKKLHSVMDFEMARARGSMKGENNFYSSILCP